MVMRVEGGAPALSTLAPPLALCSVDGRLVRHLAGRVTPTGVEFHWDGRDAHGRAVASGRYLATYTAPNGPLLTRAIQVVR